MRSSAVDIYLYKSISLRKKTELKKKQNKTHNLKFEIATELDTREAGYLLNDSISLYNMACLEEGHSIKEMS